MKLAPLQLLDYSTYKLSSEVNTHYDSSKPIDSGHSELEISTEIEEFELEGKVDATAWEVKLHILLMKTKANVPYFYEIYLIGIIGANDSLPTEKVKTIVEANGTAMLYGVAREIIKSMTARGPFPAVTIPSTNFLPDPVKKRPLAMKKTAAKKSTKKKVAKKKTK